MTRASPSPTLKHPRLCFIFHTSSRSCLWLGVRRHLIIPLLAKSLYTTMVSHQQEYLPTSLVGRMIKLTLGSLLRLLQ